MAYNQPVHGGAADSYYNAGNNNAYGQQGGYGYAPQQGYQQQPQYPPQSYNQQQQYPQQPPNYGNQPPPPQQQQQQSHMGKMEFDQQFQVQGPKYNDLWAALLFIATFLGFAAVSGLTIYGYSSTKRSQGNGIYNGDTIGRALNTNTIILL